MARFAAGASSAGTVNTLTVFAGCVAIWGTTWLAITFQLGSFSVSGVAYRFVACCSRIAGRGLLPMRFRQSRLALLGL
jgi:hypothetical protein